MTTIGSQTTFRAWHPGKALLLTISCLVGALALLKAWSDSSSGSTWPVEIAVASLAWLGAFVMLSYTQFRTFYLLVNAYVLALAGFHLGFIVPYAFGLVPEVAIKGTTSAIWIEKAGWSTLLALSCIGIGFSLTFRPVVHKTVKNSRLETKTLQIVFLYGIGALMASVIFMGITIYSFGNILNYSRMDFFRGAGDVRGLAVFLMVFPSSVILLLIGSHRAVARIFAIAIALLALSLVLLSGYRSAALFPLLVAAVLWVKVGRKIPWWLALTGLALVFVAIPFFGSLRAVGPYEKIDQKAIEQSFQNSSVLQGFTEIGSTLFVLAEVLRLVPDKDPYRLGSTYLKYLSDAFPNVGFRMETSERLESKRKALTNPSAMLDLSPSDWLTYRTSPIKFERGEGVGFSAIGEPYLNFGFAGIIVFFVSLGFFFGKLDHKNLLMHPKWLVFSCAMLWPLVSTVRNDFGDFVKPAVFILIILSIWWLATRFLPVRK